MRGHKSWFPTCKTFINKLMSQAVGTVCYRTEPQISDIFTLFNQCSYFLFLVIRSVKKLIELWIFINMILNKGKLIDFYAGF